MRLLRLRVQGTYLRLHNREGSEIGFKYKDDSLSKFITLFLLFASKRPCFINHGYQRKSSKTCCKANKEFSV